MTRPLVGRAIISIKLNPGPFCIEQTDRFLRKYPNFYQYNRDTLLPETMTALAEALVKYDPDRKGQLVPYLVKILEYRLLNFIKSDLRKVGRQTEDIRSSQEDMITSRIDFKLILDTLKGREQEVFYEYFVKDLTMKEIGNKIGRCEATVFSILEDVKKKVRKLLDTE